MLQEDPRDPDSLLALGYARVCDLDRLREGEGRSAFVGTTRVALFWIEDQIYAIKNACPHAGASLAMGQLQGLVVTCPRHEWRFHVQTGACLNKKMFRAQTLPVVIADGAVWISPPP